MAVRGNERQREFSGKKVRQGEIILCTPLRKAIFIGGLAASSS